MDSADLQRELRSDVQRGLSATPRWLSPRWFYDETGSRLFDEITRLPEYYLFRAETEILAKAADQIAQAAGDAVLIELGAGFSTKTRLLLDAMRDAETLRGIVTLDVSADALREAAQQLEQRYPGVPLHPIVGDYGRHLASVPSPPTGSRRLLVFLGSTIGNLTPDERTGLLARCAEMLDPGELFLVGTDLVKDPTTLERAYDDAAGITARFNRNILSVIRNQLDAALEPDAFEHEARWNEQEAWVQVSLRASRPTVIDVPGLVRAEFSAGDPIYTEISAKFTPERFDSELAAGGFDVQDRWFDAERRFMVTLAVRR